MKIVFLTPEEPAVIPPFFERVIPVLGDRVAALGVVSPIYKNATWISQGLRFARSFGFVELAVESAGFATNKGLDIVQRTVGLGGFHSVKSLARHYDVPLYQPEDVNAPEFLESLRLLAPDLIVSVSCPQIFKRELLELPTFGCINVHSALLPNYRGMLPTFWVLANGETETGVTVHVMTPGIDGGEIVAQRSVVIKPEDTLRSLMLKTKRLGADLVLEAIAAYEVGRVSRQPNDPDQGAYYSFPTREDVARFRLRGRRMR
jgi:methionyl-tRNA formyltransferase